MATTTSTPARKARSWGTGPAPPMTRARISVPFASRMNSCTMMLTLAAVGVMSVAMSSRAGNPPPPKASALDAIKALGLERNEHSRYSLDELRKQADTYFKLIKDIDKKTTGIEPFERDVSARQQGL